MKPCQLIVCEPEGSWAAALRRLEVHHAGVETPHVRECRNLADTDEMLVRWPASFLAVRVVASDLARVLPWFAALDSRFPLARAVALAQGASDEVCGALRQAGALDVVRCRRDLAIVMEMAGRHLARVPIVKLGMAESILAGLPWNEGE